MAPSSRRKILAGNWKMFKLRADVKAFFDAVRGPLSERPAGVESIVASSPTLLETAVACARGTGVQVYSQNCAWETSGAFTGEISALQLKDLGVAGTLVGHSERRQYFGETDETCFKRATAALKEGLGVIFCIGETLDERKKGATFEVLKRQMARLTDLKAPAGPLLLAYEPVWAIGTGVVAEVPQVKEAHGWIADLLNKAGLPAYPLLYGGSVKPTNFTDLAQVPHVSGGLVGGASLEPSSFLDLHNCLLRANSL